MELLGIVLQILSVLNSINMQELTLIRRMNDFFNFDHNIFLLHGSVDFDCFIRGNKGNLTPQTLWIFRSVIGNFTELERIKKIQSKNTFLIVVPESVIFQRNLFIEIKKIQRIQIAMKIGVFFREIPSKTVVQDLFEWCWQNRIINIFVATYSSPEVTRGSKRVSTIISFNPFETVAIKNVSVSDGFENVFMSQKSNFRRHPLRIGTFEAPQSSRNLWQTIFDVMNASTTIDNSIKIRGIPPDSKIDVLIGIFTQNPISTRKINLYPIIVKSMVIIVPEAVPYSEFSSYLQTLTSDPFFGYTLITIAAVILCLSIFRYIEQSKILFIESGADVLNLLMNDNGYIKYRKLTTAEIFLIVPLTFVGFVIVNGILSNFQSYLTRPFLQPQISTVEDIYKSGLPISIISFHKIAYENVIIGVLRDQSAHEDWNDRIHFQEIDTFTKRIVSYDTSTIYIASSETGKILLTVQKRLQIRGYRVAQTISNTMAVFIAHPEFPFTERLNEIIHQIQSAGLYEMWWKQEMEVNEKENFKMNIERLKNLEEIHVEKIPIPMVIVYGWAACIFLFFIEIIWKALTVKLLKI